MEQIPNYDLLQAIDPTKIKVPISERFAKLTLSSNKKQQQKCYQPDREEELKRQQVKRDSVSKNISKLFDNENKENKQCSDQNPLLRSESSKRTESNNSFDVDAEDLTMEPLEVSQDCDNPTQRGDGLELLSQQIASMAVESKPISISSASTCNPSELISTESSTTSEFNNIHIVRHIPINIKEALKQETITLNLTLSTNENLEKTYEITEDEDEEEDDVITISDSSESHMEGKQDVMATSSLPSTSIVSENLSLPSLTDDKAERVAAFLRDVSIQRRAMMEQGYENFKDSVDQILDDKGIYQIPETIEISRQIATADTESMTPDVDEEVTPKSQLEREKRLKDLDLGEKEQVIQKNSEIIAKSKEVLNSYKTRINDQCGAKNMLRLANDETQDNTLMSDPEEVEGEEKEFDTTSNIFANIKTPLKHFRPITRKSRDEDMYRLANDDTQCNSEPFIAEETPKCLTGMKSKKQSNVENSPNVGKSIETECPLTKNVLTPNKNEQYDPHRLVNEDTITNTMSDNDAALTQQSIVYNYSKDYKTPEKGETTDNIKVTENKSSISILTTPLESEDGINEEESFASAINSSSEINPTASQHSITILETDDENLEQHSPTKSENSENNKLSNSLHREDSSDDSDYNEKITQIQMGMANINISAKINIQIHIPNISFSIDTSDDDQNHNRDSEEIESHKRVSNQLAEVETENYEEKMPSDNDHSVESNDQSTESDPPEKPSNQRKLKALVKETSTTSDKSSDAVEIIEDEKFLSEAEKLLTQLYGKSWQTPEVMRTLKRTNLSVDKKLPNSKSSTRKKNNVKNSNEKESNNKSAVEETILHDFSIFRQNIVKTNLDSTRIATPKLALTEPRNTKKSSHIQKEKTNAKHMPQTERKPLVAKVGRNRRRVDNDRWRRLIDDDTNSEGDNASDDDDADVSWSKNASELEIEDSDNESSPLPKSKNRKNNTRKRQGRSNKSDYLTKILNQTKEGEIVYLDLSKEEVEVQDEVPVSPPANHDVTFASRLEDILKTCRSEDKPKLPSSNKKTKRKLFTPYFGDDLEDALPKEDETKENENTAKINHKNYEDDDILEDNGICPFDSKGRPKILDLVNKQLESVKTGKPIFQLTPKVTASNSKDKNTKSSVKNTPKTKSEDKFKTPLTVKSTGVTKDFRQLCQTQDYKYSFLKSLDVCVSKTLCHSDALYYRDNYRTKKEDLSKILYDMYNEKLFQNTLDVPIKWNKKLLNTAGRCLNKKKLGVRTSVIELSDKVLTSADRLRCTLIHELCHAATWIFNGEGGHGNIWKEWARKANATFPEIPKIGVCHQYDIEYKYTYKCSLCGAKSNAHSKSKKVENIRCSYCHGCIEIFLNKKDKDGNVIPTPVREPTGFAKFVKDNYKKFKRDDLKHADVMKLLSTEFASLKVANN